MAFSSLEFQRFVRYMAFFCCSATEDGRRGIGRCVIQPGRMVGSKSLGTTTRNFGVESAVELPVGGGACWAFAQ